jgi:Phytochelatin synthase
MNQPVKLARSFRRIAVRTGIVAALLLSAGIVSISAYVLSPPSVHRLSLPPNLISLDSPLGQQLLSQSRTKRDFAILAQQFQTQKLRAYCGVASSVMVLNALNRSTPPLNQDTLFTPQAQKILSPYEVAFMGMSLQQLAALLRSHQVQVETHYASETTLEQFRTQVKENLARDRDFVVVNYDRAGVGQVKGGHISPISAYHEKSDRFLIVDVASYKYPPVWVTAADLWRAMNTRNTGSNRTRGYLLVHLQHYPKK